MAEVSIRDLRNHGGDVLDRVEAGARLTVTRSGRPIAELVPLRRPGLAAATLLERWSRLPELEPAALRADVDAVLDPTL
jgi:prevent-host-death family protein